MGLYVWTSALKEAYIGAGERTIMSLSDIDQQSEFERQTVISSASLLTVSWSNPVKYGYSSAVRYWGWQTKTDITFPTKGEMFLDCIFGWHNRNSESFLVLVTDIWWLGLQQWTLTTTTSNPQFDYPWGSVSPTSVNFMDGNRHTFKCTWDSGVYNARIDSTQIATNINWVAPSSSTTFRFVIFWWSAYWIVQKSIYDFYVKEIY